MPADPAELSIWNALLASVAEEMGITLGLTGHSPNIRERKDYSCGLFDPDGRMVAQAAHIPVHLGAMPEAVRAVSTLAPWREGDIAIVNDPYLGGTHLPDVSLIAPVFAGGELAGFLSNRAHHADIGGMAAGSMPVSNELFQEGLIIPPLRLYDAGKRNEELFALILRNVRTPDERRGDFAAQTGAIRTGDMRLRGLVERYGLTLVHERMDDLLDYTERLARAAIAEIPDGEYRATDWLEGPDGDDIPITLALTIAGDEATFDFTGSAPQHASSLNAVAAVTTSAVAYCVRCLLDAGTPSNEGIFRPLTLVLPEASIVNARPEGAVSAGNVETSQRITDVVFRALAQALPERIPAASAGTMSNFSFGGVRADGSRFAYYETIPGGAGAGPTTAGEHGVQTHMTNTGNTPTEELETSLPLRIRRFALRDGSGGDGRHRGGDGVVKEVEFLAPTHVSLITDRRRLAPYGLAGGEEASTGANALVDGDSAEELPGKVNLRVEPGAIIRIETPGGGGWGERG